MWGTPSRIAHRFAIQAMSREGQTDVKLCFKQLSFVKEGPKTWDKEKRNISVMPKSRLTSLMMRITPLFLSLALFFFILFIRGQAAKPTMSVASSPRVNFSSHVKVPGAV